MSLERRTILIFITVYNGEFQCHLLLLQYFYVCGLSCQVSSSSGAPFPSPVAPMVVSVNLLCILYNCMHAHCHVCRTLHGSQMKTEVLPSILCPNPNNIFYIISYSWLCHYIYVLVIILSNTISIIR